MLTIKITETIIAKQTGTEKGKYSPHPNFLLEKHQRGYFYNPRNNNYNMFESQPHHD